MVSSQKRERCSMTPVRQKRYSATKSRSETASMEQLEISSNFKSFLVSSRSMGKEVPASAALPRGMTLTRFLQSSRRSMSRRNISE